MKKKQLLLIFCLLVLPLCAYADNSSSNSSFMDKDRTVELGFLDLNLYFSNDYLSLTDIFQETIILDLDKFSNGFNMNLGLGLVPVYININIGGNWGFGITTNVEAMGSLSLSGKLLTFNNAVDAKSYVNGALFASAGVNGFFNIQKFKFKIQPSVFYTLAYIQPDISYTFDPDAGNVFKLAYDVKVFTAFPAEDMGAIFNDLSVLGMPGIDIAFGVEYALSKNFDLGLDFVNFPVLPSVLNQYMQYSGSIGSGKPIDPLVDGLDDLLSAFDNIESEPTYGVGKLETARPFRLSAWVNWRLFGTPFLTLTPMIGFSINRLYTEEFSMEFGVNGRLNLANIFIATAGVNYIDRLWINSINLAVNLRVFEFNIGAEMRSPEFIKSWAAGGIGLTTGFKLGL